jgi:hypothetical protein
MKGERSYAKFWKLNYSLVFKSGCFTSQTQTVFIALMMNKTTLLSQKLILSSRKMVLIPFLIDNQSPGEK